MWKLQFYKSASRREVPCTTSTSLHHQHHQHHIRHSTASGGTSHIATRTVQWFMMTHCSHALPFELQLGASKHSAGGASAPKRNRGKHHQGFKGLGCSLLRTAHTFCLVRRKSRRSAGPPPALTLGRARVSRLPEPMVTAVHPSETSLMKPPPAAPPRALSLVFC